MNNQIYLPQVCQQIKCTIPGHSDFMVNKICVDKDCKNSNLVCDLCDKAHKTHREKILTIAEVQDSFLQLKNSYQVSYKSIKKIIDDFENLSNVLVSDLKQLVNQTNLMENSFLNNKISSSYSELQNQVTKLLKFVELQNGEIKFKILHPLDLHPKLHDKLTKYLQEINTFWQKNTGYGGPQISITEDQPLQQILQQNPQKQQMNQQPPPKPQILNQETQIVNLQQVNQKLLEPEKIPLQVQLQNAKFSLQDQLSTFQFTQEQCSQNIKCITPKCVQKTSNIMKNDLACLNKPLSPHEKKSFVFKINRLKGFIGIGIAIYQQVEANNFMFGRLNEVGHGYFMVLNNGLIYNNSYPKYNRITGQIAFKEGQTYKLTFDPQNKESKQFIIQPLSQNVIIFQLIGLAIYNAYRY